MRRRTFRKSTAVKEPQANENRKARDCGHRNKELWLCANGGIRMHGMVIRAYADFHFASRILKVVYTVTQQKKLIRNNSTREAKELGML